MFLFGVPKIDYRGKKLIRGGERRPLDWKYK
jgi:hypothetical protein